VEWAIAYGHGAFRRDKKAKAQLNADMEQQRKERNERALECLGDKFKLRTQIGELVKNADDLQTAYDRCTKPTDALVFLKLQQNLWRHIGVPKNDTPTFSKTVNQNTSRLWPRICCLCCEACALCLVKT
jgi:hypothetical protein